MKSESTNQKLIWLAASSFAGVALFRANSGKAWLGSGPPRRLSDGAVVLQSARPIALGLALANGSPVVGQGDLIGWRSIEITPDMIGQRVAVFLSVECKKESGGRTSVEQKHWIAQVRAAGGIAGVANSPDEATRIVADYRPPTVH